MDSLDNHDAFNVKENRRNFLERLDLEIRNRLNLRAKMAIISIDIDNFKRINNTLGHEVGDKTLIHLQEKIERIVGSKGISARVGRDEFSVLLLDIENTEDIQIILNEIVQAFIDQEQGNLHCFHITSCIGVAIYPDDGLDSLTLIRNANIAMYKVRNHSISKVQLYSKDFHRELKEEFLIDNCLREGLSENQFYLLYQPIVAADTGKIVGVEALLRWNHPKLGMVSPDKFIKIAEKNRTIIAIGKWVFKNACIQAKSLLNKGIDIFMSINVSIIQLEEGDFADWINVVIEELNIPGKMITLEITETSLMENLNIVESEIKKIQNLDIAVAIDDFGTGYSSLGRMKELCFNKLKIDKIFIDNIGDIENNCILSAIMSVAKCLNISVVAEGVENEKQLEFLRNHNCDMIQGYYFSKPMSSEKLESISTI